MEKFFEATFKVFYGLSYHQARANANFKLNDRQNYIFLSACTPSRFWFLGRHGGRLPETPVMIDMQNFATSSVSFKKKIIWL